MLNERRNDIGEIKRGDIIRVQLDDNKGSEQGGERPAVVIQNDIGNKYSPTLIVAFMTSKVKKHMPTHITCSPKDTGLPLESTILFEQIRTIDKIRVISKIGRIKENLLIAMAKPIMISFGLS